MPSELDTEAARLNFQTGNVLRDQGKVNEAIASYQRSLTAQPDFAPSYLALGQVLLAQGILDPALSAFAKVQSLQPNLISADIYFDLGSILSQKGRIEEAINFYQQAIAIAPNWGEAHTSLGDIFLKIGKLEEAISCYQASIAGAPDFSVAYLQIAKAFQQRATLYQQQAFDLQPDLATAEVHFNSGLSFSEQGQNSLAIRAYQRTIQLRPDWAEAHCNLGNLLSARGNNEEAIVSLQWAIALNPYLIEAYSNLGNVLVKQGKFDIGIQYHQEAIALKPNWAELHFNLGDAFAQNNQLEDAMTHFLKAIALKPTLAEAHFRIGKLFESCGKFDEAIQYYQQTLSLKPNWEDAHYSLGKAFLAAGNSPEAIECYRRAIAIAPFLFEAHWELGFALWQVGRMKEAIATFQSLLEIRPDLVDVHLNLCVLLRVSGDFAAARQAADRYSQIYKDTDDLRVAVTLLKVYLESGLYIVAQAQLSRLETQIAEARNHIPESDIKLMYEELLFSLPYLRDEVEANTRLCKLVGQNYVEQYLDKKIERFEKSEAIESVWGLEEFLNRKSESNSPLRIGFLSKHFRRHSVGWCSLAIIQELAKLTPDIYLYSSTEKLAADDQTQNFKQVTANFYDWQERFPHQPMTASALIEQISSNQLDILFDLDSLMNPIHAAILNAAPARMCISWLGCEAPFISAKNYYLGDWYTHPAEVDPHYREQLLRMPNCGVAIAGFGSLSVDRVTVRQSLGISPHQTVFLSVATGHKMNPDTVKATVEILKQVPESIFLHKGFADMQVIRNQFEQECDSQSVNKHRCRFLNRTVSEEEHRIVYYLADVLLDTYPYNGGTHNLEALWFNLPLITYVGTQGPSRLGYSFLQSLGIDEGIGQSWAEYIDWGVRLGKDADLRLSLRDRLICSKQPEHLSPLWNPQRFAQDLYSLLKELVTD
jgi:protein O-GlcNAc transferase